MTLEQRIETEKMKLKDGMLKILIANAINMVLSIGTNFILPKYVSVDTYAQIKTYQLVLSYAVILQLGFSDGMYIAFGGKDIKSITTQELQTSVSTMRAFQWAVITVTTIIAIILESPILIVASIAALPQNIISYYKNLFQSVGIFDRYSKIMNLTTGFTFAVNLFLIFVIKSDNYITYIVGYALVLVGLSLMLEWSINRLKHVEFNILKYFSLIELFEKIKDGIPLLFANFSSILLTSMDRWFTKILLTTLDFAHYSFSVVIENFLNVAITPLSVTLYNYFCINDKYEKIDRIRDLIICFSCFIVIMAFPIKFIIEFYLKEYIGSIRVMFFLFSAQMFLIVIRSIYANLYKARKRQNQYFNRMCLIIIEGIILNYMLFLWYSNKESFAIGTLLTSLTWFAVCLFDFRDVPIRFSRVVFLVTESIVFLICGELNSVVGFVGYCIFTLAMIKLLIPTAIEEFLRIIKRYNK